MRMWFSVTLVLLFFPSLKGILVITSKDNLTPQNDAHFVIPSLDFSNFDSFTMCGRFKINQFTVDSDVINGKYQYKGKQNELTQGVFPWFGTYSFVYCDDFWCPRIPLADRKLKHVYLWIYLFAQTEVVPSPLRLNTWNFICLKTNRTTAIIKLNGTSLVVNKDEQLNSQWNLR